MQLFFKYNIPFGEDTDQGSNNPLQPHWNLCRVPEAYRFSSAGFYSNQQDEFNILNHYAAIVKIQHSFR